MFSLHKDRLSVKLVEGQLVMGPGWGSMSGPTGLIEYEGKNTASQDKNEFFNSFDVHGDLCTDNTIK